MSRCRDTKSSLWNPISCSFVGIPFRILTPSPIPFPSTTVSAPGALMANEDAAKKSLNVTRLTAMNFRPRQSERHSWKSLRSKTLFPQGAPKAAILDCVVRLDTWEHHRDYGPLISRPRSLPLFAEVHSKNADVNPVETPI